MLKIIFLKIKIYYFNAFPSKKHFEKQPQQQLYNYQIFYTCFLLYINLNHNFFKKNLFFLIIITKITLKTNTLFRCIL